MQNLHEGTSGVEVGFLDSVVALFFDRLICLHLQVFLAEVIQAGDELVQLLVTVVNLGLEFVVFQSLFDAGNIRGLTFALVLEIIL